MCPEKSLQWKALKIMRERTKHHLFVWVGALISDHRLYTFCSLCLKTFLIAKLGRASRVFVFLKCFESGQAGRWHFEQNPAEVLHLHSRSLHCNGFKNYIFNSCGGSACHSKREIWAWDSVRPFQKGPWNQNQNLHNCYSIAKTGHTNHLQRFSGKTYESFEGPNLQMCQDLLFPSPATFMNPHVAVGMSRPRMALQGGRQTWGCKMCVQHEGVKCITHRDNRFSTDMCNILQTEIYLVCLWHSLKRHHLSLLNPSFPVLGWTPQMHRQVQLQVCLCSMSRQKTADLPDPQVRLVFFC